MESGSTPTTRMSYLPTSPDPDRSPVWATTSGLPTPYVARAALHAAAMIDAEGSPVSQARESYWHKATGGEFSAASIAVGEALLIDLGLLFERNGRLHPTAALEELLEGSLEDALSTLALEASCLTTDSINGPGDLEDLVPDPERREEMLLVRATRFDDRLRRRIGELGEEIALNAARSELLRLNRPDLARLARRVSLVSDALGYDISAPRLIGRPRLLEVKSTTREEDPTPIHISRNEADTGNSYVDWFLVVCRIHDLDARTGELLGWCQPASFRDRLPIDAELGRWESAEIAIPVGDLMPNLPLATL